MKIIIFNDTGNSCHAGCQAVSDAHARLLGIAGHHVLHREFVLHHRHHWTGSPETSIKSVLNDEDIMEKISSSDAVIVNGEGTIHHDQGQHLLAILGAAQTLRKPTVLVNAVFQDTSGFDNVLHSLEDFTVRETKSFQHAKDRGLRCRLVWDSSLVAGYDSMPLRDFENQTLITDWHSARNTDVGYNMLSYMAENSDTSFFLPLQTESAFSVWQKYSATMATARLVISGRHHANYFAAKAGVPFICLPSNTHKVEGFVDIVEEDIPIITNFGQLDEAIEYVMKNRDMFKRIQAKVEAQDTLSVFSRLGTSQDSTEALELERLKKDINTARNNMAKRQITPFVSADNILKTALSFRQSKVKAVE